MVSASDLELEQLDVKTTFLNGNVEEHIYMFQPNDFLYSIKEDFVRLLKKVLHGLKQSLRQ